MKTTTILLFSLLGSLAIAQESGVIEQMKGKKAIIRFENDIPYRVGQPVFIESTEGNEYGIVKGGRNLLERKNSVSLSSGYSDLTAKTTGSGKAKSKTTSISGKYGWNLKQFEVGPVVEISLYDSGIEQTTLMFGGFAEFNILPNIPGHDFIFGVQGQALMGTSERKIGDTTTDANPMVLRGGGFIKWFVFSPVLALRVDGNYYYEKADKTTVSGTEFSVGLNHYF